MHTCANTTILLHQSLTLQSISTRHSLLLTSLQATKVLNEQFYKSPKCVPALYQILHSSSSTQIQQLAAVELRKRVGQGKTKFWAKTQVSMRTEIKTGLLQMLAAGGALPPLVRHSISRLIAAIAKRDLPDG